METVDELKVMLVDYAKQETVGPLKLLGKWVGFGVAGALMLFLGVLFLALALLRMLQTEAGAFDDSFSWVPYALTALFLAIIIGISAWAMTRKFSDDGTQA